MYLEFYYFSFPLLEKYKEKTIIESIRQDLDKFFLYHFWKKLGNYFENEKVKANLFIRLEDEIIVPKLIFQIEWKLSKLQINELLEIFSNHWEENFILNTDINMWENKFLNLENIDIKSFLKNTKEEFEKFITYYKKYKTIDETSKKYRNFRKAYNLFLFLNYYLLKTYKNLNCEQKKLNKLQTTLEEYTWNIKLLDKRLELDKQTLEKNILVYSNYVDKIIKILKNLNKKK